MKNRRYTAKEKIEMVKRYLNDGVPCKQIAREENMTTSNIRRWVKNYQEHGESYFYEEQRGHGSGPGNRFAALHLSKKITKEERLELENIQLRIENERLKKGYIVKGVGANKEYATICAANTKSSKR